MTEEFFLNAVGIYLIALVRFSGFFINMPVFGEAIMPMRVKAGLAALCAAIMLPHLITTQTLPELSPTGYGFMALKELVLGLTLGFVILVSIDILKFSGELIGMKIGYSFVQVADPQSNRSQAVLSEFFQIAGVLLFLILGGHILMFGAFSQSFDIVPLAGLKISGGIVETISNLTSMIFFFGIQVSMPIIAIILIGDVCLGIIARTVPRMNVFQVGFALKILLGLLVISLILPFFDDFIGFLAHKIFGDINTLLNKMH